MAPQPPSGDVDFDAWVTSYLLKHGVDIKRLWKRMPYTPQGHIGVLPGGVDVFGTTTTSTSTTSEGPQFLRPDSDDTSNAFTDQAGGTTNRWDTVNEVVASNSDYVKNGVVAFGIPNIRFTLTDGDDPGVDTGHILRFRHWGSSGDQLRVTLTVGPSTTIKQVTVSSSDSGWHDEEISLSSGEASGITDYADLRVLLQKVSGANEADRIRVSWIELEIPAP